MPTINEPTVTNQDDLIRSCLDGEKLYGDDFDQEKIAQWFSDESEAYAELAAQSAEAYQYYYHALNDHYGYQLLDDQSFDHVLGIGSAYGDELLPLKNRVKHITITDPSEAFSLTDKLKGISCTYTKPEVSGDMPFDDNTFDFCTCLGVLHHIPNVSHVISECYRCLKPGASMLLREPIVSMGDWRQPRQGLTKHERGIPPQVMNQILTDSGFQIRSKHLCMFPPVALLSARIGVSPYNNKWVTRIDALASQLMSWNLTYHRTTFFTKLAPSSAFYVLQK